MGFDVRADVCADCRTISVETALTAFVALEAGRQYVAASLLDAVKTSIFGLITPKSCLFENLLNLILCNSSCCSFIFSPVRRSNLGPVCHSSVTSAFRPNGQRFRLANFFPLIGD